MPTSNLQSKPSWLDYYPNSAKTTEGVNFGFDSTGMWFTGTSDGVSYPIRTNYDIDGDATTEVIFTFVQGNCTDHSVCFFNPSIEPLWAWGTNTTRISFQVDCGTPEIEGLTLGGEGGGSGLSNGQTYTCKLIYDPSAGTVSYDIYAGTQATGSSVNSFVLSQTLPSGVYRIGFDADQDEGSDKSYFTYLSISGTEAITAQYPYPEVVFKVKNYDMFQILSQNLPDVDRNNIINQLNNQTVWIPNWPYALKHGDIFTLYGQEALQVLNAYSQINSPNSTVLEVLYNGLQGGYPPNLGGSLYFNNSYATVPASADWAVGTGDFTVEWFQYQIPTGGNERVFSVNSWPTASIGCSMESSENVFYFWTNGNLINGGSINSIYNTWAHIAVSRSSGTLYMFVNGVLVSSDPNTDDITDNSNALYIGTESTGGASNFKGNITNFQFIKGTALYTANFTPPTAPITPDVNAKLALLVSNEANKLVDSSSQNKTVTNNGASFSSENPF